MFQRGDDPMTNNGQTASPVQTVRDATVQTVSISIQTLRVGTKQVTMGMFRQLPYRDVIDPVTHTLQGRAWGHVEYWWAGDEYDGQTVRFRGWDPGPKRHIVWEREGTLYRSIVYQRDHEANWQEFCALPQLFIAI
jgi:hypothetical protein